MPVKRGHAEGKVGTRRRLMAGDRPQKQLRSLGLYRQACGRTLVANATLQDIGTWHEDPCSNPGRSKVSGG